MQCAVSIIMSVYNAEDSVAEAIDSILNQSFCHYEFIIVNDGSTDGSERVIRSYNDSRIRIIDNPVNRGLTNSLNLALSSAIGKYVARIDADDVAFPKRLESQVRYLEDHPDVVVLGGQADIRAWHQIPFVGNRRTRLPLTYQGIRFYSMLDNPFIHSSVMFRRGPVIDVYKGYSGKFRTSQDYELWSRVLARDKCENLDESLVELRASRNSVSSRYGKDAFERIAYICSRNIEDVTGAQPTSGLIQSWINLLSSGQNNIYRDVGVCLKFLTERYEVALGGCTKRDERDDVEKAFAELFLRILDLGGKKSFSVFAATVARESIIWRIADKRKLLISALNSLRLEAARLIFKGRGVVEDR